MRGAGADGAGAPARLPAKRLAMWMLVYGLVFGWVAGEDLIDEVEQALEALRC